MQQEKLVLPKFTMPGQRNWMAWALASVGGLVVVSLIVFGVVVWKNKTQPQPLAHLPAQTLEAPLAAAARPVPAPQPKAALAAAAATAPDVAKEVAPAKSTKAHRAHHSRGSGKALARAGASSHTRSSGKPDAIDELLKKFK
jgi:hypothetical protein